jgi:hypothetical protein
VTVLDPHPVATPDEVEPELLIREARRRQRRRRLAVIGVAAAVLVGYIVIRSAAPAQRSQSLLARPLHFPSLGRDGRCPVSSGRMVKTPFFAGPALGSGPVRLLVGNAGDVLRGRVKLGTTDDPGWFAVQTLWFAMPSYNGSFAVRAARLGAKGPIEVQSGGSGYNAGQVPGSGPLVVPAGPTINTFYTNWRVGHPRDPVTGRLVTNLTGYGYRTVPVGTWVTSAGCYAWQVDGRDFSETIVMDAL